MYMNGGCNNHARYENCGGERRLICVEDNNFYGNRGNNNFYGNRGNDGFYDNRGGNGFYDNRGGCHGGNNGCHERVNYSCYENNDCYDRGCNNNNNCYNNNNDCNRNCHNPIEKLEKNVENLSAFVQKFASTLAVNSDTTFAVATPVLGTLDTLANL